MLYQAELGQGQSVTISNQGAQTTVTIATRSAGQQQSQQMSVALGEWSSLPTLFKTPTGLILQLESAGRRSWVRLHANSVSLLGECPPLVGAETVLLQVSTASEMPQMQPMRMGNMEMQPMEMRMGTMHLSMNRSQAQSVQFCSQCGTKVKPDDHFCFNCGTKLKS